MFEIQVVGHLVSNLWCTLARAYLPTLSCWTTRNVRESSFPNSSQIPLRAWMQATRAVFCDPARVALAVGSGSVSMPVVLEAGSGCASCPLLLDSPHIREMRSNHSYSAQYELHPACTALVLMEEPVRSHSYLS